MDRIFSTHPMDADRIQKTEREIARILPDKPEYVVSTSEYTSIRERLLNQESKRKVDDGTKPCCGGPPPPAKNPKKTVPRWRLCRIGDAPYGRGLGSGRDSARALSIKSRLALLWTVFFGFFRRWWWTPQHGFLYRRPLALRFLVQ